MHQRSVDDSVICASASSRDPLVEDEPAVRALARRVLESAGYTVLEAADGSEAMNLAADNGSIDLLLTDALLLGLHGADLARQLAELRTGLRVLYVSGFTENSVIQHGVVAPGVSFLPKPYRASDLLRSVRAVIDTQ